MLQEVYGDETMSRSHVFEWHKWFKEGREDVKGDSRSGRPSTSRTADNVERVKQMVHGDRRLTVRMIADELEINCDSVWKTITEDLGMRKICAKMVPKLLDDDQKERRVEVCQDILEHPNWVTLAAESHHWWWVLDLWVWLGDQAPEPSVEVPVVAEAKESKTVEVQNQAHADRVFRHDFFYPNFLMAILNASALVGCFSGTLSFK